MGKIANRILQLKQRLKELEEDSALKRSLSDTMLALSDLAGWGCLGVMSNTNEAEINEIKDELERLNKLQISLDDYERKLYDSL